jgi:hypothetical protein
MGHYTELMLKVELRKDVPQHVVDVIKYMVYSDPMEPIPDNFPELGERWMCALIGGSAYHITFPTSFEYDDIADAWILAANSSFKNYDDEIERFLKWLSPYVAEFTEGVVGYIQDEEYDIPPCQIRFKDGRLVGYDPYVPPAPATAEEE